MNRKIVPEHVIKEVISVFSQLRSIVKTAKRLDLKIHIIRKVLRENTEPCFHNLKLGIKEIKTTRTKYREGEIHETKKSGVVVILEYVNANNCTIKFEDGTVLKDVQYGNIKNTFNPNIPTYLGVGYIGIGNYSGESYRSIRDVWAKMMARCYDTKYQEKHHSYKGCYVTEYWHNFQVFAKWHEENWKPYMDKSWNLDKDILLKDNKKYSPETCCFIPQEINKLFTKRQNKRGEYPIGVSKYKNKYVAQRNQKNKTSYIGMYSTIQEAFNAYKESKEAHIKEISDKWKDQIIPQVYQAMYNYQVEITD